MKIKKTNSLADESSCITDLHKQFMTAGMGKELMSEY